MTHRADPSGPAEATTSPAPTLQRTSAVLVLIAAATALLGCASVPVVDPVLKDDGSAGFAAACVGVLAAERGLSQRQGADLDVAGLRALSEWMFQASQRSSPFDDEIGRSTERRQWAERLSADDRASRIRTCVQEASV